jgi:two-component system response regulator CpxR
LVKSVLGRNFTPYDRSIDTHISNLRKKLGHYIDGAERIKTIRGVGYIYGTPGEAQKE